MNQGNSRVQCFANNMAPITWEDKCRSLGSIFRYFSSVGQMEVPGICSLISISLPCSIWWFKSWYSTHHQPTQALQWSVGDVMLTLDQSGKTVGEEALSWDLQSSVCPWWLHSWIFINLISTCMLSLFLGLETLVSGTSELRGHKRWEMCESVFYSIVWRTAWLSAYRGHGLLLYDWLRTRPVVMLFTDETTSRKRRGLDRERHCIWFWNCLIYTPRTSSGWWWSHLSWENGSRPTAILCRICR
jgi:hypothetical protein